MELLTAAQMRAIEQAAIESGQVTGLELMERAGASVVEAIFDWRPDLAEGAHAACVLCGPGNNGGDGFVVARLLKERGWDIEVFLYGDEARLPPDAAANARRWREMGEVTPWNEGKIRNLNVELIIDAIFGGGLTRALPDDVAAPMTDLYVSGSTSEKLVAIDAPSGLCLDSGRSLSVNWDAVFAFLTVTFQKARIGHYLQEGPQYCGEIAIADIGLTISRDEQYVSSATPDQFDLPKRENDHKYSHGHALIVSGGMAKTGAARLAARGALRAGAGLVTVASPPDALMENAAHLTAIMLRKMEGAEGLREILSDERINAVVIGPGCGIGERTRDLVSVALEGKRTVILDADALTSFADEPEDLFGAIKTQSARVILTPHGGEFARLFPDIAAKLAEAPGKGPAYSKVDATREAAVRSGATVLYKGPDTVIATPEGRCSVAAAVYERAAPWLATAGSGDVLAGMIAGLAARDTEDAAESAAWLHQECGRRLGPGLIAEDIPEAIPDVLRTLLNWSPPD